EVRGGDSLRHKHPPFSGPIVGRGRGRINLRAVHRGGGESVPGEEVGGRRGILLAAGGDDEQVVEPGLARVIARGDEETGHRGLPRGGRRGRGHILVRVYSGRWSALTPGLRREGDRLASELGWLVGMGRGTGRVGRH